jgi:hypothetical protein
MIPWDAIIAVHKLLLVVVVLSLGYAFTVRRLAELVHTYRLRLAEQGEKYLRLCNTTEEREQVLFYLDNALNPWLLIWSAILLPVIMIMLLFKSDNPELDITDTGLYNEINYLFISSILAANPLFGIIVIIEMIIFGLPSLLVAGNLLLVRRAIKVFLTREVSARHLQKVSA